MTRAFFPDLPDRVFLVLDPGIPAPTQPGERVQLTSGHFTLLIEEIAITESVPLGGGKRLSLIAKGGLWFVETCGDNGGAIECEGIARVAFGSSNGGPRLFLNVTAHPDVRLHRLSATGGTRIAIEACLVDIGFSSAEPAGFDAEKSGVRWRYGGRDHEFLTDHGGTGSARWPLIAGNRETGDLRLDFGDSRRSDTEWFSIRYPSGPFLFLSENFLLGFVFDGGEGHAEFRYPGERTKSRISAKVSGTDPLAWIEAEEKGIARLSRLAVGPDWLQGHLRANREARFYVVGASGDLDPATAPVEIAGPSDKFLALFERKDLNADPGRVLFGWHDRDFGDGARRPYEGLALPGLPSRLGGALRFDCNFALAMHAPDGQRADFVAGGDLSAHWPGDLPMPPAVAVSRLQIKQNGAGARFADAIAGDTAFVTFDSETSGENGNFRIALELAPGSQKGDFILPVARVSAAPLDQFAQSELGSFDYWELSRRPATRYVTFPLADGRPALTEELLEEVEHGQSLFRIALNSDRQVDLQAAGTLSRLRVNTAEARIAYDDIGIALLDDGPASRGAATDPDPHRVVKTGAIPIVRTANNGGAIIANEGVGRLVYAARKATLGGAAQFAAEAQRVVITALGSTDLSGIKSVTLDVKEGFGLALAREKRDEKDPNVAELRYWNDPRFGETDPRTFAPVLMIDVNAHTLAGSHAGEALGFTAAKWNALVAEWKQRGLFVEGGPPTPADPEFQGHVVRDFAFALPGKYKAKLEPLDFLRKLYDRLEKVVIIELGWHDAQGWTLHGSDGQQEFQLVEMGIAEIWLEEFDVWMRHGDLASARGKMRLDLPFLEDEDGEVASYAMVFDKKPNSTLLSFDSATIDLTGPNPEVKFKNQPLGLEKLVILDGGTDLKTIKLKARLYFSEPDYLKDLNGIVVDIAIPLGESQPLWIEAKLTDVASFESDGWGLTITAVSFRLDGQHPQVASSVVHGVLSLGVDGFLAVRFELQLSPAGAKLKIVNYTGRLTIGDFSAKLEMTYEKGIFDAGIGNDGGILLSSPLTGDINLRGKIWRGENQPHVSWIAVLNTASEEGKVEGKKLHLNDTSFILGRRVMHGANSQSMLEALENPSPGKVKGALGKLAGWKPAMDVDLVIGAYGNLGLDKTWFPASDGNADEGSNRKTGILLTSGGLFQISASSKFLGVLPVEYDLTLNTDQKWIFAGFQVPKFDPLGRRSGGSSAQMSNFSVSGGYVGLGLSYDPKAWAFALTVGWPYSSFLDPDIGTPDWSRAVTVKWDGAFPLNTFQGGVSLFVSYKDGFAFGLALRAGWTWSYSASAWKLTAEAELGIMVAGVLHIRVTRVQYLPPAGSLGHSIDHDRSGEILALLAREAPDEGVAEILELATQLVVLADDALAQLASPADYTIKCGLFIDAWGGARVKFFGVTLIGVRIDAHAQVIMVFSNGRVTQAFAKAYFKVQVKIGCTTYRTEAHFKIDFAGKGSGLTFAPELPPPPLQLAAPAGDAR